MMNKKSIFLILFLVAFFMILLTAQSNAAVETTRDVYSYNGSMNFYFTGLELDTTHEYEFGLTRTSAAQVTDWYTITTYTATTATININTATDEIKDVVNAVNTGYITIKDVTEDTVVLQPYAVDLTIPYLRVTSYQVVENGHEFGYSESNSISIPLRTTDAKAYFQYEKITDTDLIEKYKEIKENDGDFFELESMLKTAPTGNWKNWDYLHIVGVSEACGYPERTVTAPDEGLYYLWVYFTETNMKDLYGCILVDNLQPEIAMQSVSLPRTRTVELGKTLTLTPTFNPSNATNKIVTWKSSDTSVATVDNAGRITPKKVGSTIITVTTQDGNKSASCTVTVTRANTNNNDNQGSNTGNNSNNNNNNSQSSQVDNTIATGKLPQTGIGIGVIVAIIALIGGGLVFYYKYRHLKDI